MHLPIFYSAMLLTAVNLLLRLVGTAFQVFLSGRIGAAGIGLLQLVMSVGSFAVVAGVAGVRTASMYLTAGALGKRKRENVTWVLSACFLYSILFSGSAAAVLFHFAPQIARVWIGNGGAAQALRLFAAFLPVVCLANVMTGYFTAANRIGTLAAVEVAEQLASMAVTAALLAGWAGTDAVRACQSVLFGNCCGACLTLTCLVLLRLREHPAIGPRIPMGRAVASTALPLALADVLKSGINTVENLMVPQRLALHRLTPDPLAAFGIVGGMVFPVLMFPACILFGLTELLIPELARCAAGEYQSRIRYLTKRSLRIALLYGLFFGGLEYLLADRLCLALYGNAHAGTSLKAYAPLIPMLYCDAIVDAMTKGLGQQKICVRYNILTSAMDVALLWLLLPGWGMKGYFVSFTVTHAVNFFLSLRLLLTITGVRLPFYVPAFAVTSVVLAVWGAGWFSGIPGRITGYVLLLGSLWCLLRVTGREDILWLRGLLRKK